MATCVPILDHYRNRSRCPGHHAGLQPGMGRRHPQGGPKEEASGRAPPGSDQGKVLIKKEMYLFFRPERALEARFPAEKLGCKRWISGGSWRTGFAGWSGRIPALSEPFSARMMGV